MRRKLETRNWKLAAAWALACFAITAMCAFTSQGTITGVGTVTGLGKAASPASAITYARTFAGTNADFLTAADSASLQTPSTAITLAFWIQWTTGSPGSYPTILAKFRTSGNYSYEIQQVSTIATYMQFQITTSGGSTNVSLNTGGVRSVGNWYFVVCRWASGGNLKVDVYNADTSLNESKSSAGTNTGTITYTSPLGLYVGGDNLAAQGNKSLIGQIANVYIDSVSLTDPQVATLLTGVLPAGSPSGAWVPLCGNSPENDLSGHSNNLTVNGTTSVSGPAGVAGC